MLRFLHTADVQIGMTAPGVGQLARRVQEARLESLERVLALGRDRGANFVVVAGDLFEHNRVPGDLVARTADLLRKAAMPVFISAGNHDYYGADSVYLREEFRSAGDHVVVFSDRKPVPFRELDVTIYPCPCFETRSYESPVAWITKQQETTYHVCVAHGNLPERIAGGGHEYPMRDDELRSLGMDYIALGHWHSVHPDPSARPDSPYFYSGTPEPTKFGEPCSGYALLVELNGATRTVTPLPTGRYRYVDIAREVRGAEDVQAIRRQIEADVSADTLLVRLVLSGVVSVEVRDMLDRLTEELGHRVGFLTVRDDAVLLAPTDEELRRFPDGGMASRLLGRLRTACDGADDNERATYSRAIALAYRLLRDTA